MYFFMFLYRMFSLLCGMVISLVLLFVLLVMCRMLIGCVWIIELGVIG